MGPALTYIKIAELRFNYIRNLLQRSSPTLREKLEVYRHAFFFVGDAFK